MGQEPTAAMNSHFLLAYLKGIKAKTEMEVTTEKKGIQERQESRASKAVQLL